MESQAERVAEQRDRKLLSKAHRRDRSLTVHIVFSTTTATFCNFPYRLPLRHIFARFAADWTPVGRVTKDEGRYQ
jgi:hypothetical protein